MSAHAVNQHTFSHCRHTCHALCTLNKARFPTDAIGIHECCPRKHPECHLDCPAFDGLTPERERPITVLFVLEDCADAKNAKAARLRHAQYGVFKRLEPTDPTALAYENNFHLRDRYVFSEMKENQNYIVCHDWLQLCSGIRDPRVIVEFQAFSDHASNLSLSTIGNLRLKYDLIVTETMHAAMTRRGDGNYEDGQAHDLSCKFFELSSAVQIYPNIIENYRYSQKFHLVQDLEAIAREVTNTPRPQTSRFQDAIRGDSVIAKRSASAYAKHIYRLQNGAKPPSIHSRYHSYHFQEFVPALDKLEIRLFVVNGTEVIRRIATLVENPDDRQQLTYWQVDQIPPLHTYGETEIPPFECPENFPEESGEQGVRELDGFAIQTLQALISRERRMGITTSSIQHFVRMDVGCIYKKAIGWQYFVNEVTRFPGMNTWPRLWTEIEREKVRGALVKGWLEITGRTR